MKRLLLATGFLLLLSSCDPGEVFWREGDVRFKVTCNYSHSAADDPIVYPDQPGAAHMHDFTGNTGTDASTNTWAELQAFPSTCNDELDKTAQWTPALLIDDVISLPDRSTLYYRRGSKPANIKPWASGLMIVAGYSPDDPDAPTGRTGWQCDEHPNSPVDDPFDCTTNITLTVEFPDCWDGVNLDSLDHRSHMSYAVEVDTGAFVCPNTHPVPVPQITMYTHFRDLLPGETITGLSSGGVNTVHGDYLDGWDPTRLQTLIDECLNGYQRCNSGGDEVFNN